AGQHRMEERIKIRGPNQVYIEVVNHSADPIDFSQLMNHFYLVPDGKSFGYALPLEFAWLPALHGDADHLCSDHFFRSPVVAAMARGAYGALIPDLRVLSRHRPAPHALDLRVFGTKAEAPRLSYGISTAEIVPHVYARHRDDQTVRILGTELAYSFDLFFGEADSPKEVASRVTSYLWKTYGEAGLKEVLPQVLPFEEYGRRYSYKHELRRWAKKVNVDGQAYVGIDNEFRRGANFHAWENDLHVGFGVTFYGDNWKDDELRKIGEGILHLALSSPQKQGAFACVYNLKERKWEGSLYWTARPAEFDSGYDAAAMGVSAWWLFYWYENLRQDPRILEKVVDYAQFLQRAQLPSGAIPTYFYQDLSPAPQLLESATTSISGAVLAKAAHLSKDPRLEQAAVRAGRFVDEQILPKLAFQDFEVFYSCSPKPLHWIDNWSGILPHNTLAIQWAADQFLALYTLTHDAYWLRRGEYILNILSLYQQVWNPPFFDVHLFGGFGVMNTDGEWSDGRQARFVSTYADYYAATWKPEYLQRAVAACRAGFALMDIEENHANNVNQIPRKEGPGLGYSPENIYHNGPQDNRGGWTGFNWGPGGALAASAYLEKKYGTVWVDLEAGLVFPIDGVAAEILSWNGRLLQIRVTNPLADLPLPYKKARPITIRFGRFRDSSYDIMINGQLFEGLNQNRLSQGIEIDLPGGSAE
ncbi:hypothetical protein MYX84_14940, partial [Acidobacteria bacterium AH-259-O06]|nr:hypothetical protein [Acidobacteria bacterium AH-259-O06]